MIKRLKNLSIEARASISYTIANVITKGIGVVSVPIFTRILTTSEVGVSTIYTSWYTLIYAIVTLSLSSGSLNVAMKDYKNKRSSYESACLTLSTFSAFIFTIIVFVLKKQLLNFMQIDESLLWLLVISLYINPAMEFWMVRQRYEYKYKSTVVVSILSTLCSTIAAIGLVLFAKNHTNYNLGDVKVIAQGVVLILFSFVIYIVIMVRGKNFIDFSVWKYALTLSLPLIIHTLSKNVLDMSDRLMISSMCGKSQAGIYGTIYTFSMASLIVWYAINNSIIPAIFNHLEKEDYDGLKKLIEPVLLLFSVIAVVATLFAPEIVRILFSSEYYEAVFLMPALSAGIYFTALYNIYGNFLLYKKKTINIMLATMVAAVLNIFLNYIFIGIYGYIAAAYTTFVSFIVLAIMQEIMVRKVFGRKIVNDKKLFLISSSISIVCLLCNLLYPYPFVRYIIIAFICIIAIWKKNKIFKLIKH